MFKLFYLLQLEKVAKFVYKKYTALLLHGYLQGRRLAHKMKKEIV
jgi:hypothetical protein